MNKKRIVPTVLGLALLAIALPLALSSRAGDEPVPERSTVQKVEVAAVETTSTPRSLRFPGTVRSEQRARLSFQVSGRLAERPVEIGDRVKAGQTLARLDEKELRNGLASSEGTLAQMEARRLQARQEATRVEKLFEAGAATQEELEETRAAADSLAAGRGSAKAQVAEARRRLAEARLVAPFDGIVSRVSMEPGEYASPGAPVLEISGDGRLEVEIGVPESLIPRLRQGGEVTVELPMIAGRRIPGTLRSIGGAAGTGRLFPVVVSLEDGAEAAAGMTAEVVLEAADGPLLTVPLQAILNPGASRPVVFRLNGEAAQEVVVEVERLVGERVAVQGPLSAGDEVVIEGHFGLVDGDAVEVQR